MSGRVTLGGKPLANSIIVLTPRFRSEVIEYTAATDYLGNYSFEGIPPGTYEAVVAEYSEETAKSATLTVPSQVTFEQNFDF
jgi:hypothetical protein